MAPLRGSVAEDAEVPTLRLVSCIDPERQRAPLRMTRVGDCAMKIVLGVAEVQIPPALCSVGMTGGCGGRSRVVFSLRVRSLRESVMLWAGSRH